MIKIQFSLILFLAFGCGPPSQKPKSIIGDDPIEKNVPEIRAPVLPEGAVTADFNGNFQPFYAFIKKVDLKTKTTFIGFEDEKQPQLIIPESLGAVLSPLKLEGFDREILMVNAKLKDTNFNKYFLFVLRENQWKPVVNGFAIHKSNMNDTLMPAKINPENAKELLRYYSGFEMDALSEKKYGWVLLLESVPIENW